MNMRTYLSFVGYYILIHFFVLSSASGEIHFDPLEMVINSVDFHLKPSDNIQTTHFYSLQKSWIYRFGPDLKTFLLSGIFNVGKPFVIT